MTSAIRQRLDTILRNINEPVTAAGIKARTEMPQTEHVVSMALKAMKRDGVIREWQPGWYTHKEFQPNGVVRPRKRQQENQPMAMEKASARETALMQDLDDIKAAIEKHTEPAVTIPKISDLRLKTMVLDRLAAIVSDDVSAVLIEIRDDIKAVAAVER